MVIIVFFFFFFTLLHPIRRWVYRWGLDMYVCDFKQKLYVPTSWCRARTCPSPCFDHRHEKDVDGRFGYNGGGGAFASGCGRLNERTLLFWCCLFWCSVTWSRLISLVSSPGCNEHCAHCTLCMCIVTLTSWIFSPYNVTFVGVTNVESIQIDWSNATVTNKHLTLIFLTYFFLFFFSHSIDSAQTK